MVHVTCDLCGNILQQGMDQHFVVHLEVYSAHDPTQLNEDDLDRDYVDELNEMLSQASTLEEAEQLVPTTQQRHFDLCMECKEKFLRDPLHRESDLKLDFSEN